MRLVPIAIDPLSSDPLPLACMVRFAALVKRPSFYPNAAFLLYSHNRIETLQAINVIKSEVKNYARQITRTACV